MFKRNNRLSKDRDIQKAIKSGRVFFNPNLNLKFLPQVSKSSKFTVVVGTKVAKKAVTRNRIKRISREEIKKHINTLPSGDYIVFVKPSAVKTTEEIFLESLKKTLNQAKNLHK